MLLLLTLAAALAPQDPPALEIFETTPLETSLDLPEFRQTHEGWIELFEQARKSIDLEHFYFSPPPEGQMHEGRLDEVIAALLEAAGRGVRVRIVADAGFHETYPQLLDRFSAVDGFGVRLLDLKERTGGVVHGKLALVDGHKTFLGSANFDWRSLEHVHEIGVRVESVELAAYFGAIFEHDWRLAGGEEPSALPSEAPRIELEYGPRKVRLTPSASPQTLLGGEDSYDLPRIVDCIDSARERLCVQFLSYATVGRDGEYFDAIDAALRRADARGVRVAMLIADWSTGRGKFETLASLDVLANVEVRIMSIPEWSGGFIDYGRVAHGKYLVADGRNAWLGTSNASADYFSASRNFGLSIEGRSFANDVESFFRAAWESEYATKLDPCSPREPRRRAR